LHSLCPERTPLLLLMLLLMLLPGFSRNESCFIFFLRLLVPRKS
jgi:hypothetical protein